MRMNAIKKVRKYLQANPESEQSRCLAQLVAALAQEEAFPLKSLYQLDMETFGLAVELMRDWRLERYYASRLKLFDTVQVVLPAAAPPPAA